MSNVRIGSDPETFLQDHTGRFISSVGLIGGSKDEPMPIGNNCSVQEDNVTVEFNTHPTDNVDDFVKGINYNLDWIKNRASQLSLTVVSVPSAVFDDEQLARDIAYEFIMNNISDETIEGHGTDSFGTGKIEIHKVEE